MTPTQIYAECTRIAAIVDDASYVAAHVMSGVRPDIAISVTINTDGRTVHFNAPSWEEMFAQAEAGARQLMSQLNAGDLEYASWMPAPELALAAE